MNVILYFRMKRVKSTAIKLVIKVEVKARSKHIDKRHAN